MRRQGFVHDDDLRDIMQLEGSFKLPDPLSQQGSAVLEDVQNQRRESTAGSSASLLSSVAQHSLGVSQSWSFLSLGSAQGQENKQDGSPKQNSGLHSSKELSGLNANPTRSWQKYRDWQEDVSDRLDLDSAGADKAKQLPQVQQRQQSDAGQLASVSLPDPVSASGHSDQEEDADLNVNRYRKTYYIF